MVEAAQQEQTPSAPPVEAPPSEAPPAEAPAQPSGEAPSDGRQPEVSAYAALRSEQSTIGRQWKATREALDLDREATPEEVTARIAALKAPRAEDPTVELPPEIVAEQNRLAKRAWQSAQRDFGENFTSQAQDLQELVMTTDDPYELTAALHELAATVNQPAPAQPNGENPEPPAGQQPPAQPQEQPPGIDAEVGQPGWKVTPDEGDKPGTGDTRGFFEKVFPRGR